MSNQTKTRRIAGFLLLALLVIGSGLPAQFPAWGFAPNVAATLSGNTLTLSVYDYIHQQIRATNLSPVAEFQNAQGVVAYKTTNGLLIGTTFDVNLGQWKEVQLTSLYGLSYEISNGVIGWRAVSGGADAATYDPAAQQWKVGYLTTNSSAKYMNDGVFAWTTNSSEVYGAIYDPTLRAWQSHLLGSGGNLFVQVTGDYVNWVETGGKVATSVYDRQLHQWQDHVFAPIHQGYVADHGIYTWTETADSIHVGAYDFIQKTWHEAAFWAKAVQPNLGIQEGTAYFQDSIGIRTIGFDILSDQFQMDGHTVPYCQNLSWTPTPNPLKLVYLQAQSVGGTNPRFGCGDGNVVQNTHSFKAYLAGGPYVIRHFLWNLFSDIYCDRSVMIDGATAAAESEFDNFVLSSNPIAATGILHLDVNKPIFALKITNLAGQLLTHVPLHGVEHAIIPLADCRLASGVYVAEIEVGKQQVIRRKLIVE